MNSHTFWLILLPIIFLTQSTKHLFFFVMVSGLLFYFMENRSWLSLMLILETFLLLLLNLIMSLENTSTQMISSLTIFAILVLAASEASIGLSLAIHNARAWSSSQKIKNFL